MLLTWQVYSVDLRKTEMRQRQMHLRARWSEVVLTAAAWLARFRVRAVFHSALLEWRALLRDRYGTARGAQLLRRFIVTHFVYALGIAFLGWRLECLRCREGAQLSTLHRDIVAIR